MRRRAILTLPLLAILILSWTAAVSVHASSLNYRIHDERVSVDLSLHFFQNATAVPAMNGTFAGSSGQDLASALEEGLRKRSSSITVSSVSGELISAKGWINSTIRFQVTGVSTRKGSLLTVNCSWIPFNVSRDLRIGDLNYNLIGAKYVRPAFEKYVNFDKPPLNESIASVTYLYGAEQESPSVAVNRAGNATLLDFGHLASRFEWWKREYNVTEGLTRWSYNPETTLDLTMTVNPREGAPSVSRAFYRYNATVSVDGLAQAEGDTISTDASGSFEPLLMLAVVLVTFAVAVMASWSYRSRRRQTLRRRR